MILFSSLRLKNGLIKDYNKKKWCWIFKTDDILRGWVDGYYNFDTRVTYAKEIRKVEATQNTLSNPKGPK